MNLHEYQAKEILQNYNIPIPEFFVVHNMQQAKQICTEYNLQSAIVKIQVHAGGRGKAGGVKFAKTQEEILGLCQKMLGMKIVNAQTGPNGIVANSLLLSKPQDIEQEYYLSFVIDREQACPVLIASREGGMEIEELAQTSPEKILKIPLHFEGGLKSFQLIYLAKFMGWKNGVAKEGMALAKNLAKAFLDLDASLLEINPLILTKEQKLVALDAKLSIDDNAMFRHEDLALKFDVTQITESERLAKEFDLSYIALEGEIGCMVNGAGLAMATMDIIQNYGAKPANFLDVGGSATKEKVAAGFSIILSDPNVKAILVNIFGGIMNCATIAHGVVAAAQEDEIEVPLIVRLEGTNVEEGKKILKESNLNIISAQSLSEAAQKAVEAIRK